MSGKNPIRIAAIGDIHYTKNCKGRLQKLFTEASKNADILVISRITVYRKKLRSWQRT
jgi:hypothetical protein